MRNSDDPYQLSRRNLLAGTLAVGTMSWLGEARAGADLSVIVHPSNHERLSLPEIAAVFTTRKQSWSSGKKIMAFNFPAKHEVRVAFDREVLRMSPDEVARYWIDRRIRGGNPPPKQVNSAQIIVRLVAKLEGAIAYVPRGLVDDSVRVLTNV